VINDLLAEQLRIDENIHVAPEAIMVTVGAQEAMTVLLMGLIDPARDVLLVSDPSYIGITGIARGLGLHVVPVPVAVDGVDPGVLSDVIRAASAFGRVRALYDIPDFNNPLGTALSADRKRAVIDVCHAHDVLVIEDNAYGMFAFDGPPAPTMKSLDRRGDVIYIGSVAKTVFPSLRVGYLVADQQVDGKPLAAVLSKVKSFVTVNTPAFSQAAVGGILLRSDGSLRAVVAERVREVGAKRDRLLTSLADAFGDTPLVRWGRPSGGFFTWVALPFAFGREEMRRCAADYGVVVSPMAFFSQLPGRERQIRLSFSAIADDEIDIGVSRLAAFVRAQPAECGHQATAMAAAALEVQTT
jgi:(S)-3,5-dihydroxyphenylglycine transaminase